MRIKKLLLAIATLTLVSATPVKHQFTAAEQQQIILDASANCISFQRDLIAQQNSDAVDALKEKGVEFIDLDKAELQAKVEPVYEKYSDKLPADIMEKIRNT